MGRDNQEENFVPNYLLKPIEIPTNLSLLTERLPKSKKFTEKIENSNNSRVNECLSFDKNNLLKKSNSILEDYKDQSKNFNNLILPSIKTKMKDELNNPIIFPIKSNIKNIFRNNHSMIESILDKPSEKIKNASILDDKYYSPNIFQIKNKNLNVE